MDNLQLRQRIVRGMIRVSERTANMRKPEKFEYRKHMTAAFMDMLELCIEANRSRGQKRVELQNRMDTKLDVLRSLVDTAVSPEDRLISPGLHEIWSKELNEIGRMLGGWKKSNEWARGECVVIKGGALRAPRGQLVQRCVRWCAASAAAPARVWAGASASAPLLPFSLISCGPRPSRGTKAKGTHFPADKAIDTRSCSSPVEATGGGGQTAQAGRSCYAGEGRPGTCGAATAGERPIQGVSHAGQFYEIMEGAKAWNKQATPPFWNEYTRGKIC